MELRALAVDLAPAPGVAGPLATMWDPAELAPLGTGTARRGPVDVAWTVTAAGSGTRYDITLRRPSAPAGPPVALGHVRLRLGVRPSMVLEHGWQSWSAVARRTPGDTRPARRLAPWWVRAVYHADPSLAGRLVAGDQFLVMADGCGRHHDQGGVVGFLDGRCHLSTVVAGRDGVTAVALLDGVTLAPGETRTLDPLWLAEGDPGPLYSEYLDHWADEAGARAAGPSPAGWCSWYQYFWKVTPADVRANLTRAAAHGLEVCQLDDGWQRAIGDWRAPRPSFAPAEVPALAREIAGAGLQPGLWTAPFLAAPSSEVARRHPDWLARRRPGRPGPRRAMWNPLAWKGWALALDPTHPAVLDHLTETYAALVADGWTYHKIDFCYAGALTAGRAGDGRMTRAEGLRAGLAAVRAGIGDQAYLVGCGIPLAQSVGVVDALRVSPDTAPSWTPGPLRLPGYPDLAPAAGAALEAGVLRAPMHRRLWVNDPDCLLLRPTGTRLTDEQRALLVAANAGTGGFAVVSDDLSTYGEAQWAQLAGVLARRAVADTRLDLPDPFAPVPVVTGGAGSQLAVEWAPGREPSGAAGVTWPGSGRPTLSGGVPGRGPWAMWWAPGEEGEGPVSPAGGAGPP